MYDDLKNGFRDDPLQPDSFELVKLQERLADDDHVQAVEQLISQTDHRALYEAYRGTGSNPFRPERLLAIVMVLILQGILRGTKCFASSKFPNGGRS